MKILLRILLFLLVLCLLAGLVAALALLVPIPWLSGVVQQWAGALPWLPVAVGVVLIFFAALCVLGLILTLSVPAKRKQFILPREMGTIEVTRQSIESAAAGTLEGIPEVKRYHVQARGDLRPGKVKLAAEIEPRNGRTDLVALGQQVQQRLARELADSLEIDPRHIRVTIKPVQHQSGEAAARHSRVPRVV